MKIKYKKYCLKAAQIVIDKFYKKEFQNSNQEKLNYDATLIKVLIQKTDSAIKKSKNTSPIGLTEDTMIFAEGKNSTFFQLTYDYFEKSIPISKITYERIFTDWVKEKDAESSKTGIDKYFNTRDPHFNHNAYYWRIEINTNKLFSDLETPFKILTEYLEFKYKFHQPIKTIDRIENQMDENNLNKDQRLFIYDKLNGLIANADVKTQNKLSILNIEILDRRWNIEPYDLEEDIKKFDIDNILEETKQVGSYEDQISFLRRKQLEFGSEKDDTGFIEELLNNIQIEIDCLYLKLNRNKNENTDYIKSELSGIKKNQKTIISNLNNLELELSNFSERNKLEIENLQKSIDSDFIKLFKSDEEKKLILDRLDLMAKESNTKEEWYNQPIKSKLKVMLPLILFKYERELDISNFKLPKNLEELKQIFIND